MRNSLVFFFLLTILFSCTNKDYAFLEYKNLDGSWHKNDTLKFQFAPKDTIQSFNVYIQLRNNLDYEFRNIYLISSIVFPNGKVVVDTLEYPMAYPDGEFMGKGANVIENKLWLKENVTFNEEGEYIFKLQQSVRKTGETEALTELNGILDVGIQVEEIKNNHEE